MTGGASRSATWNRPVAAVTMQLEIFQQVGLDAAWVWFCKWRLWTVPRCWCLQMFAGFGREKRPGSRCTGPVGWECWTTVPARLFLWEIWCDNNIYIYIYGALRLYSCLTHWTTTKLSLVSARIARMNLNEAVLDLRDLFSTSFSSVQRPGALGATGTSDFQKEGTTCC